MYWFFLLLFSSSFFSVGLQVLLHRAGRRAGYGNSDIILDHLSRISQLHTT